MPSRIRPFFIEKDGSSTPLQEIEILSLATNVSPLPAEAFSTNQPFMRSIAQTFYASNDSTFYYDATGGVQFVAKANAPGLLRNMKVRQQRVRNFYLLFALLLALPPLWALWNWQRGRARLTGTDIKTTE